ncbi:hypothetical protein B0H17DRAFT_1127097 [Mycena rosella]|uniref:Uncharacterized protein n=1 Tax=Mycena rosella TaxID=1033263 RepID=A0AAD7GSA0_MYCRO|nr:hypothetical protein B0H17DRAFT_1127097 [Mycena rosella]
MSGSAIRRERTPANHMFRPGYVYRSRRPDRPMHPEPKMNQGGGNCAPQSTVFWRECTMRCMGETVGGGRIGDGIGRPEPHPSLEYLIDLGGGNRMSDEDLDQIWRRSDGWIGSGAAFDCDAMRENIIFLSHHRHRRSVLDQSLVNSRPLGVVLELWVWAFN